MIVVADHPYQSIGLGTFCVLCWGWVDDPRHLRFPRKANLVLDVPLAVSGRRTPIGKRGRMRV